MNTVWISQEQLPIWTRLLGADWHTLPKLQFFKICKYTNLCLGKYIKELWIFFLQNVRVFFFLNLIYIVVSQINWPWGKQKNYTVWLISPEQQLIDSSLYRFLANYRQHIFMVILYTFYLSALEVLPYRHNTENCRYSLTTVVLNLLLSYSAPQISTSTKGQAMLLPSLGRWRAPKTCKSNCKL